MEPCYDVVFTDPEIRLKLALISIKVNRESVIRGKVNTNLGFWPVFGGRTRTTSRSTGRFGNTLTVFTVLCIKLTQCPE
jgi:hypothetical protein